MKDYRLDTVCLAVSQHYRLMKTKVLESRATGKPVLLTGSEAAMADYLVDVMAKVVGRRLAAYCSHRFRDGYMKGDLRSYKVKLALINLKDQLKKAAKKGSADLVALYDEFSRNFEAYVTKTEELAGCTADSKRRNKKAREERARRREERRNAAKAKKTAKTARCRRNRNVCEMQMELGLECPGEALKKEEGTRPSVKRASGRKKPGVDDLDSLADRVIAAEGGRQKAGSGRYGDDDDEYGSRNAYGERTDDGYDDEDDEEELDEGACSVDSEGGTDMDGGELPGDQIDEGEEDEDDDDEDEGRGRRRKRRDSYGVYSAGAGYGRLDYSRMERNFGHYDSTGCNWNPDDAY